MGLVFLISAALIFVSIFVIFRLFEKYGINNSHAIIINYLTAASFSFLVYQGDIPISEIPNQSWFIPSIIIGMLFMGSFLLYAYSTQIIGIAITATSSKMSVIIPVLFGAYVYEHERLGIVKIIGLVLAISSFYLIFKKEKSNKFDVKIALFSFLIFAFSGINDTVLKYIREIYFKSTETDINTEILFMGSLFSIAFIAGLVVFGSITLLKKEKVELKSILSGVGLGLVNFFSALSMFKAMGYFESGVFFPIFNVGIVGLSALIGIIFFKEKMTTINRIGILLALVTILLLALN